MHLQEQTRLRLIFEDEEQLQTEVGRVAQKNFNFTFECIKEATRLFSGEYIYFKLIITNTDSKLKYFMKAIF